MDMKQTVFSIFVFLLFFSMVANSQNKLSRKEYIELYKIIAIQEMHRSGIPASITMAQGCLESNNGNSVLSKKSNNHFGIKCKTDWSGMRVYHNDDEANECFRRYTTVEESYEDHTDFLMSNLRYASLFKYKHTDYKSWAKGLKSAGYATDPSYAERLIQIIEDEKLYLLDDVKPSELAALTTKEKGNKSSESASSAVKEIKDKTVKAFDEYSINPYGDRDVVERNGLVATIAKTGDTYEDIAREYDMKNWEIYTYNDLNKTEVAPKVGEVVYLERKRFSAPKGNQTHQVKEGETLWSISQQYGMRKKCLIKKNRLSKDTQVAPGDKLYLRKKKPSK